MPVTSRAIAVLMAGTAAWLVASASGPALADDAGGIVFGKPVLPPDSPWLTKPAGDAASPAPAVSSGASFLPDRPKPTTVPTPATAAAEPNLSALRFYASQNDLARVAAEIRLLRARYPGWEPPTDLFSDDRPGESEQPLWDLFAKHDLRGVKDAIAERQKQTPGWKPSNDLAEKLALALAYDTMVQASDAKQYGTVLDIAAASRGLLTCGNVDAVWRSAEALALTGDEPHAVDAYRYVLTNCTNPGERLATVQKAGAILKSTDALNGLVAMGKPLPDGTSEFADLRFDGMRRRIGEALAAKQPASPADLDALTTRAHAAAGAKDAELLGWYGLSRQDFPGAAAWFREALAGGPSAKAAEGLVLALRDGGKPGEAVAAAQQYASLGPDNRKLMVEVLVTNLDGKVALPTDAMTALGTAIDDTRAADAAQALGWHLFKAKAFAEAQGWFRKSLAWQPGEAAAVGMMVTARQLKQSAEYAATVSQYSGTYPRVAELATLMRAAEKSRPVARQPVRQASHRVAPRTTGGGGEGWDKSATDIVDTFQSGQVDQALAMMDARRAGRAEPKGLSVVRGWALYKKGDWEGARQVFNEVGAKGMPEEASKGLKQIDLGYTNPRFR